jgi:hypothetical protein
MQGTRKQFDQPTREAVEARVKAFLDDPQRKSTGGWAEVPEWDRDELSALIRDLVKFRYEPDPDGDRPMEWQLCDRTRQEPFRFRDSPKLEDNLSNFDRVFEVALFNLGRASSIVQQLIQAKRYGSV